MIIPFLLLFLFITAFLVYAGAAVYFRAKQDRWLATYGADEPKPTKCPGQEAGDGTRETCDNGKLRDGVWGSEVDCAECAGTGMVDGTAAKLETHIGLTDEEVDKKLALPADTEVIFKAKDEDFPHGTRSAQPVQYSPHAYSSWPVSKPETNRETPEETRERERIEAQVKEEALSLFSKYVSNMDLTTLPDWNVEQLYNKAAKIVRPAGMAEYVGENRSGTLGDLVDAYKALDYKVLAMHVKAARLAAGVTLMNLRHGYSYDSNKPAKEAALVNALEGTATLDTPPGAGIDDRPARVIDLNDAAGKELNAMLEGVRSSLEELTSKGGKEPKDAEPKKAIKIKKADNPHQRPMPAANLIGDLNMPMANSDLIQADANRRMGAVFGMTVSESLRKPFKPKAKKIPLMKRVAKGDKIVAGIVKKRQKPAAKRK